MNKYVLIMNLGKEMQKIYEKSLEKEEYKLKFVENGIIFAKKEFDEKIDTNLEEKLIDLVVAIAKKYTKIGVLYIDLSEEFNLALKDKAFDINKDGRIRWKIRQEVTKAITGKKTGIEKEISNEEKISNEEAMQMAIEESKVNRLNNYKNGGPFGAIIVKEGKLISIAHNTVVESKDPTAHAEINAIRLATKKLDTHDLTGCSLYVNAEPCPMCLSAIIWANIKEVYFANTRKEAGNIGFRDDMIYEYLGGENKELINIHHIESKEAKDVFEEFKNLEGKVIY